MRGGWKWKGKEKDDTGGGGVWKDERGGNQKIKMSLTIKGLYSRRRGEGGGHGRTGTGGGGSRSTKELDLH